MSKHLTLLADLSQILTEANVAIPIIFATVASIGALIRGLTGSGPSVADIADLLESQLEQNDQAGHAEIARLRVLLG